MVWNAEKTSVCRLKNVPVCTGTTSACIKTCGRSVGTHGDVLNPHTEVFFFSCHTGRWEGRKRGRVSPSVMLTMNGPRRYHLLERFTERTPWILQISSLRIGREQHVPDSSNHSLFLLKLFSLSCPEGHCGGNDKHTTPSLLSLPHHTTNRHDHKYKHQHQHKDTHEKRTHTHAHVFVYVHEVLETATCSKKNIVEGHKLRTADIKKKCSQHSTAQRMTARRSVIHPSSCPSSVLVTVQKKKKTKLIQPRKHFGSCLEFSRNLGVFYRTPVAFTVISGRNQKRRSGNHFVPWKDKINAILELRAALNILGCVWTVAQTSRTTKTVP